MNMRSLHITLLSIVLLCASPVHTALIVVNSTGDQPAANPAVSPLTAEIPPTITLRSALQFAQANADASNTINFNIPLLDPGFSAVPIPHWTIKPNSTLMYTNINKTLIIDGYAGSPAGAAPNTDPVISNAVITIEVSGENLPGSINGIRLIDLNLSQTFGTAGTGSLVFRGLCLNRVINSVATTAASFALFVPTQNSTIAGNFIGTDITGMSTQQVAGAIALDNFSFNNTIGGGMAADRNILVGDLNGRGILAFFSSLGLIEGLNDAGTSYNTIQGNIVGLAKDGTTPLGTNRIGMSIRGAHNLVGGPLQSQRNVIANTIDTGISIRAGVYNTIQNNYIGTDATGLQPRGAGAQGILIGAPANTIDGNVITNASSANVFLTDANTVATTTAPGVENRIINNRIGCDAPGLVGLSPLATGIQFAPVFTPNGGTSVTIFYGDHTVSNNLISGNKVGIVTNTPANRITYDTALITGNKIGTDSSGQNPLPNLEGGMRVTNSKHITIGGDDPGLGNTIAFNGGPGILFNEVSSKNDVLGNVISNNIGNNIVLEHQSFGNVIGYQITNNASDHAVFVHQQSDRNIIQGNTIVGGPKGVVIGDTPNDLSVNNAVISNTIIAP